MTRNHLLPDGRQGRGVLGPVSVGLIGLLGMCSAPVRAVLDHNFRGGDRIGPQTGCSTPMPLSVRVQFFGGVTPVIAAIISTALIHAQGGGSR